jgi:hypothetical protein
MKRTAVITGMLVLLLAVASQAQGPAPKPGPEQKKLQEIYVGNWTYEGVEKATPLGPAGKISGKFSAHPILGGFFVECHGEENGPSGSSQWQEIDGYDPISKLFTWKDFASDGGFSVVTYTFDKKTQSYSGITTSGDKQYKMRGTAVFNPDFTSYVEKREISEDGKTWMPWFEAKGVKAKSAPK